MGDMVLWAPHVVAAVAQFNVADTDTLAALSTEEVKRLALLGAMVIRAHRQLGVDVMAAVEAVKQLYGIIAIHTHSREYDKSERPQLIQRYAGIYHEIMTSSGHRCWLQPRKGRRLFHWRGVDPRAAGSQRHTLHV